MKKFLAILVAKQAAFWSKRFGRGGGGALPGLIAEKIDSEIIPKLTRKIPKGVIVITGTNGKTTTSKMITDILTHSGISVINNQGGSNLSRGLASLLIEKSNLWGTKIKGEMAVYEIDEATMPEVMGKIEPSIIVVTNVFRDQLDRYGEVDKTAAIIAKGLEKSPKSLLVLNGDDPMVASLASGGRKTIFFGINDKVIKAASSMAIDSKDCLLCGTELIYEARYYGHVGVYKCPNCKFARPDLTVSGSNVTIGADKTETEITFANEKAKLTLPLAGLFNLYNALAAASACYVLKVESQNIVKTLATTTSAFGRMEKFKVEGNDGLIFLVKNPIGFNQVIESIINDKNKKVGLLALNDNFADGTDISWIWDVEFGLLAATFSEIIVTGTRAEDLALRLKYDGLEKPVMINDTGAAFKEAIQRAKNQKLYILATYTAMLDIRKGLVKEGALKNYWE